MRSFYTIILILFGIIFTSNLQAQACDYISGNINVGGDVHDPGLQSNNNKNTVATLSNGNFVIAWETRDDIDGDDAGAFFQVFSEAGAVVTSIIMPYADINPSGTGKQGSNGPLVVALTGGGFVIGWESEDGPGDTGDVNQDVYFRVYSNDGTAVSGTTRISVAGEEDHLEFLLPLSTGGFVVLTRIEESDQIPGNPDNNNNTDDFFFQAFNASGNATSGSPLNITSDAHAESFQNTYSGSQVMADLGNGNFVVTWEGRNDIDGDGNGGFFRVFNANGTAVTGVVMPYSDINAAGTGDQGRFGPQVVALAGGNFVTSWESRGGPGDVGMGGDQDQDVYFRVYGPTGTAVSGTVKANGDNTAEEDNLDAIIPLTGGNFAIVYHTDEVSPDTDDFYFRVFNASGSAVSSSIEVSGGLHTDLRSFMSNDDHRFAALNNGNFVMGWSTSGSTDGSATECYYRVFSATGTAVSAVVRPYADINPTGVGNQGSGGPTLKALPEGFAVVWPSEQGPGDVGPGNNDDQDVYHQVVDNDGMSLCGTTKTNGGNDSQEEIFEYAQPLQNGNFMVLYRDDEDTPTFANQDDYFFRVIGGAPEQSICPTIGTVSGPSSICSNQSFTLTASGLENMAMADNDEQNYSINFVVSTVSTTNPYVNTSVLGTVPFNELTGTNTTAILEDITTNFPNSTLYFYAILGDLPDNDNCRPFAELVLQNDQTPTVSFTALADLCSDAGVQSGLGSGSPAGGVYSGPGVTDDGNGMTYSFTPATAGLGEHTITYTISGECSGMSSGTVTVYPTPDVSFTALPDLDISAGVQTGLGGGAPAQGTVTGDSGVYSGPGVTDDGNGMTYSFDPTVAGVGMHTLSYTYTSAAGCSQTATGDVTVSSEPLPGDMCTDALDINTLFGQTPLVPQISDGQDNTGYGTDATDPTTGFECHFEADPLQNTSWYAFVGDGNRYLIRTIVCNDSPANLDLQAVVYSGECGSLTDVVCNEDEDGGNSIFNVSLEMDTEIGTTYLLMLDGYTGTAGAFCLEVTNLTTVGVTDLASTNLRVYPNPTTGEVQLPALSVERVEVFDASGRLVINQEMPGSSIDLTALQSGFYLLKMYTKEGVYSTKVVKD
ncbi:T9SS type A sorting domain-containing protein [Lewinella cohaerens]|uniref:T9SS type A sorting domain-containing protein n=1 Tax=Lewinella cohaerens TaxID=70995 RepID=UPI0005C637F4|nr:T9SS type A sorting domain-containing protein [Lewinella cohaerens]